MRKKRIKINVTQKDILAAIEDIEFGREICSVCPVARATRRHKGFEKVRVSQDSIHPDPTVQNENYWRIDLPAVVHNWIIAFDMKATRNQAKPIHFYIEVPQCLMS